MQITLPNDWSPRPYQLPVLRYLQNGGTRAVSVWARRHGKDSTAINWTAQAAFRRVGTYWHVYPTLRQARKAIWDGIDRQGRRIIEQAFPPAIVTRRREDDMKLELINGSGWQLVGADNYDALVGSNPVGIVLSEWSIMDPKVWDFLRPIVRENGGWVWWIYTPRGKNHGWDILQTARNNPDRWFSEVVDIRTAGVLDVEQTIAEERADGMPEELIQQEYFCSFEIGVVGAVFSKEIQLARDQGRITEIPYDPNYPVETAWDIGFRDSTAIWFIQRVGMQVRAIDYYENRNLPLQHYIGIINSKPYAYSRHIGPFDLNKPEMGSGNTIKETAENFGVQFEIAPKIGLSDGINAARAMLHKTWFAVGRTDAGVTALENYKYEWDEDKKIFTREPVHDWASHGASAFRYFSIAPDLDYLMPDWLRRMTPAFSGVGGQRGKPWNQPMPNAAWQRNSWTAAEKVDPLAAFRQ